MKPSITIFTPTYNRAHTLPKLYESLKLQNFTDFEWLIVDDGSTDTTEELVKEFQKESEFVIRYVKQKNQGKHIAINTGVKEANGRFFMTFDSDDYFLENALSVSEDLISKIEIKTDVAGFTFIRFQENILFNKNKYGKKEWFANETYEWEFHGEMVFTYRLEVLKTFPFPQFEGEKFCPESLIHHRIGNHYRVLYTDCVLASGEYLEDGLTSKYAALMEKNPRAALLYYSEKLKSNEFDKSTKQMYASNYWNIALKAKHIKWAEKFSGISFTESFSFWKKRLFK